MNADHAPGVGSEDAKKQWRDVKIKYAIPLSGV